MVALVLGLGSGTALAGDAPANVLLPAPAGFTTELVLRGPRTIVAGSTRKGVLVVRNRTGAPIDLRTLAPGGCTPRFTVALTNADHPAEAAFTLECGSEPFVIDEGRNRLPFSVHSSWRCSDPPRRGEPRCPADGSVPPLPPGRYRLELFGRELALPAPAPLKVRMVR